MGRARGRACGAALGMAAFVLLGAAQASAKKHRLREIRDDSVDLVMSTSWDFSEAGASDGGREYLEPALRKFAERTFQMTEGRLRICKVYVYKERRNWRSADIVAEPTGRANAALGGLRQDWGQIHMFRGFPNKPYDASEFGITLAHEFGHYGLYLRDEYTEPKEPGEGEQSYLGPRVCDAQLITMMGSKSIVDLSMPKDYADRDHAAWSGPNVPNAAALTKREKYQSCEVLGAPGADAPLEDATWRTPHYRHYQMSAWELITLGPNAERLAAAARDAPTVERFASIAQPGMPEKLSSSPPSFDGACFDAIFMDGAYAVLVIDRSASMATKTGIGETTYFDRAIAAAKTYVSSAPAGTTISVVEYSSQLSVVVPPTKLEAANLTQARAQISASIDALGAAPPAGDTSLDIALTRAFDMIVADSDQGNDLYVLAISDGVVAVSDWNVNKFVSLSIPIFTQNVGAYNADQVLRSVSQRTRGEFKSSQAWQHDMIEDVLRQAEPLGVRLFPKPSGNAPLETPIEVSELDGSTSFRAEWSSNDAVSFELVKPDGSIVTPAALPAGVSYEQTEGGAIFRIAAPEVGTWTPRLVPQSVPTGDVSLDVVSDTPLRLAVTVSGDGIYPNPWFVRAKLGAPQPVIGARVSGKLTRTTIGSAPPLTDVKFTDDGTAPDETGGDGVYTAVIANVSEDGSYVLDVSADNPGGARIDASAVADEPGPSEPPLPLSSFTRTSQHQLEAVGHRDMPQSPTGALSVRNDLTPIWVTIDQPGDVVWLKFNGYARGRYVAMTGDLVSNDAKPLTSRLSLYDTDGTTLLAESAEADGRAFLTLHTPDVDGVYFLKVEHTASGTGRLRVAVAPEEWLTPKSSQSSDDSGGGDSGGCAVSSPSTERQSALLALLGLTATIALRRRGRRAA